MPGSGVHTYIPHSFPLGIFSINYGDTLLEMKVATNIVLSFKIDFILCPHL